MCEFCEKGKKIQENDNDNIFFNIWGRHLQVQGKLFTMSFGRDVLISYCPICGRKLISN